jgi:hypothetical protein
MLKAGRYDLRERFERRYVAMSGSPQGIWERGEFVRREIRKMVQSAPRAGALAADMGQPAGAGTPGDGSSAVEEALRVTLASLPPFSVSTNAEPPVKSIAPL